MTLRPVLVFDAVLAATLPLLAWRVVAAPTLQKGIVLFIALGLLSALAWARLDAVDVALVEAAVGSGLTGALLMSALAWAEPDHARTVEAPSPPSRVALRRVMGRAALGALFVWLGWTVIGLPSPGEGLRAVVDANIDPGGVRHPVTAVLLDFRGYDTLIEVAVLVVAAVAIRQVQRVRRESASPPPDLLGPLVNILVPISIVTAGYLVWVGSHAPGGAFQAGAILAGSGVVLLLSSRIAPPRLWLPTRATLVLGPAAFLALAAAPLLVGGRMLEYPRAWTSHLVLALEVALSISIALILVLFFPGPPPERAAPAPDRGEPP